MLSSLNSFLHYSLSSLFCDGFKDQGSCGEVLKVFMFTMSSNTTLNWLTKQFWTDEGLQLNYQDVVIIWQVLLGHVNCLHAAHILRKSLPPSAFCISIQVCLHNFQHLYSRCSHSTYSQASFTTICIHTAHTGNRLSIVACKVKLLFTICVWCTVALVLGPAKKHTEMYPI